MAVNRSKPVATLESSVAPSNEIPVSAPSGIPQRRGPAIGVGLLWLPAYTLWVRELVRFYRQRGRVIGVIGSPIVFWLVLGSGFGRSMQSGAGGNYLEFFFPGTLLLILLFTATFTMMSVIEDRREGFLLSVLVAPCTRTSIALGKIVGGATLAGIQGMIFVCLAPLIGMKLGVAQFLELPLVLLLVSFALTAIGFLAAWRLDSTHAFHAIINLFLIPAWLVSGAVFPMHGASTWLRWLMLANPLTYGLDALRAVLGPAARASMTFPAAISFAALIGFDIVTLFLSMLIVRGESRHPPA